MMIRYSILGLALLLATALSSTQRSLADGLSPFADKPCDSYSNYIDDSGKEAWLIWGHAPFTDYGSRVVQFNQTGVRPLRQAPAAGIHPRILFGPDDLDDVRKRLKETRCGQEAWKNILSWTEMMKGAYDDSQDYAKPDRWNGGFGGLHGRVPLFRLSIPRVDGSAYNHNSKAAEFYKNLINGDATGVPPFYWDVFSLEAFRCLIENDESGAKNLAKAVVTLLKADQAIRANDPKLSGKTPEQPIGRFQLAFVYDFIFNWLTPEQKQAIHDELAAGTWSHDNYGTFNTAESSRSNWATFSYWLYEVLGIEGEPGFNDLKVRGMYRGWRDLLTYGWFQSGATFEGEAKNQIGMDGVIMFARRQAGYGFENLCGHPYLQAYARKFMPASINPMLTGFNRYDLLGGSRGGSGGFSPCDVIGLKYMFPDDKVIDWVYRQSVQSDYQNVPDRPDGYYNGLLFFAIFASDYDPANKDVSALNLPNTFFCGERSLLMTRSSWSTDALMLNLHTRGLNGGHPFADRNGIMVAGAGRVWSPNGYASFRTQENSVVCIDGSSQNEIVPGRMADFQDAPMATFATGDASYAWDWTWKRLDKPRGYYTLEDIRSGKVEIPPGWEPVMETANDFALTRLSYPYLSRPAFEYPHWIKPKGAYSPYVKQPLYPVQKAFRTAGIVRGPHPYALVVDDIRKDNSVHHYEWNLHIEPDIQIASISKTSPAEMDIILTGTDPDQLHPLGKSATPLPSTMQSGEVIPPGQPMLLVRVLNRSVDPSVPPSDPDIVEKPNIAGPGKYGPVRRLVIPSDSIEPGFKILLYPYRQGAPIPDTAWTPRHDAVHVEWTGQNDMVEFVSKSDGSTRIGVNR